MRLILTGGTLIQPERMIEDATVVIEDNIITEIWTGFVPDDIECRIIDVSGRYIMAGIIDLHNDGIEKHVCPRPGARFAPEWALMNYDRYLAGCGITTEFHALYFANISGVRNLQDTINISRSISNISGNDAYLINHRVLHRYEASRGEGLPDILECLTDTPVKMMSINDHTPGQGQYRKMKSAEDIRIALRGYLPEMDKEQEEEFRHRVSGDELASNIDRALDLAMKHGVTVASHDDDSAEKVDFMYDAGVRICEFPVTMEAARRARELGMTISMGSPNVMIGGSLSGNLSALDLIEKGLVDTLCADYYAPALLAAVFHISELGLLNLNEAAKLITLNPAVAIGVADKIGSVEVGKHADLIVVHHKGNCPEVELVVVNGQMRFTTNALGFYEECAI